VSSDACVVVIGPAGTLSALTQKTAPLGEVLAFADGDARKALETIAQRKPAVFVLERLFAATPRGAALINRVKADSSLTDTEIRVIAHDSDYSRVSPRKAPPQAQPLDQRGTRRAPRFKIGPKGLASIDAVKGTLVDLSTIGAQLVTTLQVKPGQNVRMSLDDKTGSVRFNAVVMWASFEIPSSGVPRYRAGLEFSDADGAAVDAFIGRRKAT
jgi:PilZ domain-containing protein